VLATNNRERDIIELSNEFYTHIPQSFGMKRPPLINHMLRLKEKIHLLDILSELEIANSMSLRSIKGLKTAHPADVYYQQLK
jgi:poly [ADP-ribose] polymerase